MKYYLEMYKNQKLDNSMEDLILIGGGGHAISVIDVIERQAKFKIIGVIDNGLSALERVGSYPVLGGDNDIPHFSDKAHFLITVGKLEIRRRLINSLSKYNLKYATIVSPTAILGTDVQIDEGVVVHHFAILNSKSLVKKHSIINTRALVEHETIVEENCHISTGAILNGNVHVGMDSFIGSGALVKNGITIAGNITVGMGGVVIKDLAQEGTYVGNPAHLK